MLTALADPKRFSMWIPPRGSKFTSNLAETVVVGSRFVARTRTELDNDHIPISSDVGQSVDREVWVDVMVSEASLVNMVLDGGVARRNGVSRGRATAISDAALWISGVVGSSQGTIPGES